MDPSLPVVAEELLQEIQKSFGETSQISDELLLACHGKETHKAGMWRRYEAHVGFKVHSRECGFLVVINVTPFPSWLRFIFGTSVVPALDLVDRQSVTRLVSPSGRTVYQVVGSSGKLYTCYGSCHFCSCPAFAFSVLRKGDNLVCKHILAVYLSRAIGACQEQTISNQQMTALLLPEEK